MDYQEKYQCLKRKLKVLLYEQESFQKELEKSQIKLLRVSRDKTFLLDRLLLYEQVSEDSLDDSDATLSSDNEAGMPVKKKTNIGGVATSKQSQEVKNEKSAPTLRKTDGKGEVELSGVEEQNVSLAPAQISSIKQETPDQQRLPAVVAEDDPSMPE